MEIEADLRCDLGFEAVFGPANNGRFRGNLSTLFSAVSMPFYTQSGSQHGYQQVSTGFNMRGSSLSQSHNGLCKPPHTMFLVKTKLGPT
jgi:hypothetical protein